MTRNPYSRITVTIVVTAIMTFYVSCADKFASAPCPDIPSASASTCTTSTGGKCPVIDDQQHYYPSALYIMRHCDKEDGNCPDAGKWPSAPYPCFEKGGIYLGCSDKGHARAAALPGLFDGVLKGAKPAAIICARYDPTGCSGHSAGTQRPCALAWPLSQHYNVPLTTWCRDGGVNSGNHAAAYAIRHTPAWNGKPVIMVWDHNNISNPDTTITTILGYLKYTGTQHPWGTCDFSTILKVTWPQGEPEVLAYSDCYSGQKTIPNGWNTTCTDRTNCCLGTYTGSEL